MKKIIILIKLFKFIVNSISPFSVIYSSFSIILNILCECVFTVFQSFLSFVIDEKKI